MNQTIVFYNWTDEDFTWKWNNEPFFFKAKTETPFFNIPSKLQVSLRSHFAKHLVDRELTKMNKMMEDPLRAEMEARCNGKVEVAEEEGVKEEITDGFIMESEPIIEKRKPGRPSVKKTIETVNKSLPEEQFAGLQK